ncbi:MAG TPA: TlpA disulfide reductase family protein [Thermoanaerobaculia bacterium]|nr:TlpA disulfide reductase family protein [Thermoanaerobaculia bacterium]
MVPGRWGSLAAAWLSAGLAAGGVRPVPLAGSAAPDFSLRTVEGETIRLSGLRGRAIVLDFWAPWCAPCRAEAPSLVALDAKYRSRGLVVIGAVADDSPRPAVEKFAHELGVRYAIGPGAALAKSYGGADLLPQTFFIGRDGRIVSVATGLEGRDALERRSREILGEKPDG